MSNRRLILMVCTGNTCRSPMAAALLRHALAAEAGPIRRLGVASAGISAYAGDPPSSQAVRAMDKVNVPLAEHRSQRVTEALLDEALIVIGMTNQHLDALYAHFERLPPYCFRLLEFARLDDDLDDPFGGPLEEYEACRDAIVEAIPGLLAFLRSPEILAHCENLPTR